MYHYIVLRIGLKMVQQTETCRQFCSNKYICIYMLCFDWINYFIRIHETQGILKLWKRAKYLSSVDNRTPIPRKSRM